MTETVTNADFKIGDTETSHLAVQDLESLDINQLTPLSPQVISRQATINIGTIGHVAHGKSTVVKAVSNVKTIRFKSELVRNITIKLGYANAKIFKCTGKCSRPGCYASYGSIERDDIPCVQCGEPMSVMRHVSFVDCPGHDILMATMLNGAAVMDAALLLIAGNESCPQPQTSEHLAAIDIMKLEHIIILQNKIDLVNENEAAEQYKQIVRFIKGTIAEGSPILPISAQLKFNIDALLEYIVKLPVPIRDFTSSPRMIVIRSFDINYPGSTIDDLKGGVAGGSIIRGVLKIGDRVEVRPGVQSKDKSGQIKCTPITTHIVSLYAEQNDLQYAVPGGLIGVGTNIDPTLCRADRLVGQVLGFHNELPEVFIAVEVNFFLLRSLVGVKTQDGKKHKVVPLTKGESLMLNIGSLATGAMVVQVEADLVHLTLVKPVCTEEGENLALSRRVDKHWRLIGWGKILKGVPVKLD